MKKSKEVRGIMHLAEVEADINNDTYIIPVYIAIAILTEEINIVTMLLVNENVDIDKMYEELMTLYGLNERLFTSKINKLPSKECRDVLIKTELIAMTNLAHEIELEHLFLGLLSCENEVRKIFNKYKINYSMVIDLFNRKTKQGIINEYQLKTKSKNKNLNMDNEEYGDLNSGIIEPKVGIRKTSKTPTLDEFGDNISELAQSGRLQKVFGRDKEVERITQILCRKTKRNPIIVGEPGVGKSAIVEGLAIMIHEKLAPKVLHEKIIISMDVANLVSGTKYRGQFEQRMKLIIQELKNNPDIILFIDEIHTMVGAGSTSGALDASNILKPALAKGDIQVIGSTTFNEYKDSIEKDGALNRRLQKVIVEEPTVEETKIILKNIKKIYEDYHNVSYSNEVIDACVELSNRYIQDKSMPDKAIDILDESGSAAKILLTAKPKEILKIEEKIAKIIEVDLFELDINKKNAIKSSNFEEASKIRDIETLKVRTLDKLKNELSIKNSTNKIEVTIDIVNKVTSTIANIPVEKLTSKESSNVLSLNEILNTKVIGQSDAISKVSKAIIRNKSGVRDPSKPTVFMFLGPTGVGKTLLAKEIAETVYGSSKSLIRIDMSEYSEKFMVNNLIGSPQGYVGYGEGGKLTESVRRKPYSVVLFDEIEKAHPEIFNIFLQILDEGRITDGNGRLIDFKNTLIIMTSNVGVKELSRNISSLGFETNKSSNQIKSDEIIKQALKKKFAPEFLNRIGETIIFNKLNLTDLYEIVKIELNKLELRINSLGFKIKFTPDVINYLAEIGFDPEYGARPLQRIIETQVMDIIGEEILRNNNKEKTIIIDYNNLEKKVFIS